MFYTLHSRLVNHHGGSVHGVAPQVNSEALVGTREIADRLGLAQAETVHAWRRRHAEFPAPLACVSGTLVWHWPDVEAWARATGRLK